MPAWLLALEWDRVPPVAVASLDPDATRAFGRRAGR
jgi:hypothetical protein